MSENTLNIIQINLRHSASASAMLGHLILERNVDFVLIQEPYVSNYPELRIPNVPKGYSTFHNLNEDHAYGVLIIARDRLKASKSHLTQQNAAVGINMREQGDPQHLSLFSIYARPSTNSIDDICTPLLAALGDLKARTVIGMDANAKNKTWRSPDTNERGSRLELITQKHGMNIANYSLFNDQSAFIPAGTSYVDITIVGDQVEMPAWQYLDLPSGSDHPLINFLIDSPANDHRHRKRQALTSGPALNKQLLLKKVSSLSGRFLALSSNISSKEDMEHAVTELSSSIADSAKSSRLQVRKKSTKKMQAPWWNAELETARSASRALFRRWSKLKTRGALQSSIESYRASFKLQSAKLERLIRFYRSKFRRKLCTSSSNKDLLSSLRAPGRKGKQNLVQSSLVIQGSRITDKTKILETFRDVLFQQEAPSNNQHSALSRKLSKFLSVIVNLDQPSLPTKLSQLYQL
jgi:hypothetical protein